MSTRVDFTPGNSKRQASPPFVGALLRMCWEDARRRITDAIRAEGFNDIQDAHLVMFRYPLPDGVRPSLLARQRGMSRQAANYLVAQLESLGYLERRVERDSGRRLVYLTKRGRKVAETIYASMQTLEGEWSDKIGRKRFSDFMNVLRILAAEEQDAESN